MKKLHIKHIAFVMVAAILFSVVAVGVTYSWIDDVKMVEFQNADVTDGAPLKSGMDINAQVEITKTVNTIGLGNSLTNDDLTYTYTENDVTKKHAKYDNTGNNAAKTPNWTEYNNKKGYFYESGGMHLSGCYGNGETFYFPQRTDTSSTISGYREGNKDDENVNYISFTAKVSSPDANVDFWFKQLPTVKKHGSNTELTNARYAITVDGKSHVYSSTGSANTCNAAMSGIEAVNGVRKTSVYTYNNEENKTASRGKNSNTLFSVNKGSTVLMNVKIWLEEANVTASAVDIDLQLVSSWAYTRTIKIVDKTTDPAGTSWIGNHSATLFLTLPDSIDSDCKASISDWQNSSEGFFALTKVSGSNDTYSVTVPLVYNNEQMFLYRCTDRGWNNRYTSQSGADQAVQRSDHNVYCWNWWKTNLPNTYIEGTYTLYGCSWDKTATDRFGGTPTNKGYGTWGAVEHILVYSHYGSTDYASKSGNLFIRDHSDEDTSGEIYTYIMYRADNNSGTPWQVNIPASSSKIQFHYYLNDSTKGTWGYKSWSEENPQRRPLKSTGLYANNSTVYHFAQNYGGDKGWGYWEGADTVYLIKSSFLSSSNITAHSYMFTDSTYKRAYPGDSLTRLKDTNNQWVTYTWGSSAQTYTADVYYTVSPRVYRNIIFNNGDSNGGGDDQIGKKKTGTLNLFPGCFYQVDGSKWYGSLDDKGRDASSTGGDSGGDDSGGGDDAGGGSMDGYTQNTTFTIQITNKGTYNVKTNGTDFKAEIQLDAGTNWATFQKSGTNFGNGKSGQTYDVKDGLDLYLSNSYINNVGFRAQTSGTFIVSFQYDNGNQNTIKVTSILKKK